MGGTGLEPVTPSLSIWCSRSRQCAGVRSDSIVEPNPKGHRTVERTRTNTDPCHPCHALLPSRSGRSRSSVPALAIVLVRALPRTPDVSTLAHTRHPSLDCENLLRERSEA